MVLGTAAIPIGASLLANANRLKNDRVKITAQNQAAIDKYEDDQKSWDMGPKPIQLADYGSRSSSGDLIMTGPNQVASDKPRSFYDNSGSAQTINVGPAANDISADDIKGHLKDLYANAFGRDPEYNDDMSDTADYWIGAVQRGDQGDRDWTKWLDDSIYGSQEFKTQGPGLTPHDKDWVESLNRSGGGGSSGPSMEEIRSMVEGMFSRIDTPWTPYGYGWGGTNSNAVRINRSQGSRRGTSYAGNRSSFNRSGSRLNSQGTPWMNTLGM